MPKEASDIQGHNVHKWILITAKWFMWVTAAACLKKRPKSPDVMVHKISSFKPYVEHPRQPTVPESLWPP